MTTRYDILTSRRDGDGKTRWTKIGVMFPAKQGDGFSIKLEALPLPNEKGEVWLSAFVPRERDDEQPRGSSAARVSSGRRATTSEAIDDAIPFAPEWR